MAPRAYLRLDPHVYDRKVLGVEVDGSAIAGWRPYPPELIVAFIGTLALADMQPERGRFRSAGVLVELLRGSDRRGARYARQVSELLARGDLVEQAGGRLYVDGWDEWQEGDLTVAERMRRYRARRNAVTAATVTAPGSDRNGPSDGARIAEAVAVASTEAEAPEPSPQPQPAPGRQLDVETRAQQLAANRELLADPTTSDVVRRAALRALQVLDPAVDWRAPE